MVSLDFIPPEAFLEAFPEPMRDIAERLRAVVRQAVPEAIEAVRPGWRLIGYDVPSGRRTAYFAYIAPEAGHVHLGFEHGLLMHDPAGVLLGRDVTRQVRWLTFLPGEPLDDTLLESLLHEAVRVALMKPSERLARRLDRETWGEAADT